MSEDRSDQSKRLTYEQIGERRRASYQAEEEARKKKQAEEDERWVNHSTPVIARRPYPTS